MASPGAITGSGLALGPHRGQRWGHTERQAERYMETGTETKRQTETNRERQRQRDTETETEKEIETERQRETQRQTERRRDTQRWGWAGPGVPADGRAGHEDKQECGVKSARPMKGGGYSLMAASGA